jgi:5-formyltetrahydrofolate cyclo-ligase
MRSRLAALSPELFTLEGEKAAACLRSLPLWERYAGVLLFLSTGTEIDTGPLLDAAFSGNKRVFVPKIDGERLEFYRVFSPGPWKQGPFNIREPPDPDPGLLFKPEGPPALIIAPGLAFDRRGNRLGHGRGYYDRFFAGLDRAGRTSPGFFYFTIGLCLEIQLLPEVPAGSRDKPMDALCTGTGLYPGFTA